MKGFKSDSWYDDEPELMAVAGASFDEHFAVSAIGAGVIQLARQAITRDTVTLNISQVRPNGATIASLEAHDARLDHDAPPARHASTSVQTFLLFFAQVFAFLVQSVQSVLS
jgi:hypothetical protein